MNRREMQTIVQMLEGHWQMKIEGGTRALWDSFLLAQDAEQTTKAVAYLAKRQHFPPRISDLADALGMFQLSQAVGEQRYELPEPEKYGGPAPEWVWVWSWCRYLREPQNMRSFPQQVGHVDDAKMMSMEEYDKLRSEWLKAGSPKARNPIPLAH